MPIANLHDLLVHELKDLYSAERQLVKALPRMAKSATSPELKQALTNHLAQTEEHVVRLETAFEMLGASGRGQKCKGMEGLIEEGKGLLEEDIDPEVLDAGIIAASQRIEHYEIAAYGTVREYARSMDQGELMALLDATLAEEKTADTLLSGLAEGGINALAERGDEVYAAEDEAEEGDASDATGANSRQTAGDGNGARKRATKRR